MDRKTPPVKTTLRWDAPTLNDQPTRLLITITRAHVQHLDALAKRFDTTKSKIISAFIAQDIEAAEEC